ncbi:potassium channel family protein [Daejeonella oryzae]|uniref:potassium channel family protein n=1 Tax=Daejeonella oryzae TaxID=1122943 RepID=UPI00068801D4|nr:potassium channel family protein [Daejeonella oryzae]
MKQHLKKLVYGNTDPRKGTKVHVISHFKKIENVWNSSQYYDFGIERITRLFLVVSKVFFPGIYIDYLSRNSTYQHRKITGEFYIIFKTVMPFLMLYYSLWHEHWLFVINIYLLIETFLYIFHKIFLPEHNHYKTHNRSLILLFFNFIEVIASFGVVYAAGNYLNRPVDNWADALYFSFITGATIGYGDYHPVNEAGKLLVMLQIISTLSFLILFFNFFAPRVQDTGFVDLDK